MQRAHRIFFAFALSLGCHQQPPDTVGSVSNNVITQSEIEATGALNVYDVVVRLHSNYLNDRGRISIKSNVHSRAVVFMNDQEYGILETMRNIPTSRIAEIRYYSPTEAIARYGSQYGGGVILLISRSE